MSLASEAAGRFITALKTGEIKMDILPDDSKEFTKEDEQKEHEHFCKFAESDLYRRIVNGAEKEAEMFVDELKKEKEKINQEKDEGIELTEEREEEEFIEFVSFISSDFWKKFIEVK